MTAPRGSEEAENRTAEAQGSRTGTVHTQQCPAGLSVGVTAASTCHGAKGAEEKNVHTATHSNHF